MTISEFQKHLSSDTTLEFILPDNSKVPAHFHITEAGLVTKHFLDCGGKERIEEHVIFQVWVAEDFDHRLTCTKLSKIINISEHLWTNKDPEIEIEYQAGTINKFGLDVIDGNLMLTNKKTACLALDKCGIDIPKVKIRLSELTKNESSCTPGGGCC